MYHLNEYVINWDKVKTLEDMKEILKASTVTLGTNIDNIKHLVDIKKKVKIQVYD